MDELHNTDERILLAFVKLAAEQGITAVTTREVAIEAGVNPVTLFRRFGDKQSLAVAALNRFCPIQLSKDWAPKIDLNDVESSLLACLLGLNDHSTGVPGWISIGLQQVGAMPEVQALVKAKREAAYRYLRSALAQAAPALRPEVDHHVTVMQWLGMCMYLGGEAEPVDWASLFQRSIKAILK